MNGTLVTALVLLVPTLVLLVASIVLVRRTRTPWTWLQLSGAGCLVVVVLTHLCEALDFMPWMHWGESHSVGHYLDFASAVGGLTMLPMGYLGRHQKRPGQQKRSKFMGQLRRRAGVFDIDLHWHWVLDPSRPDFGGATTTAATPAVGASLPDDDSLFTALKEQLGLRLQSERDPLDVVVIDHIEHPSPD